MSDTIFSKIIAGVVPCHRIYEDRHVLSFLDISPVSPGHSLVIPKEPARTLDELSDEAAGALGRVLPRICRAIKRVTGCSAYNVLQNNEALAHQAVFHVHFHIIPKPDEQRGLGVRWPAGKLGAAPEELALAIAAALTPSSS
jgi:histidine triad (HIT) family protein